MDKEGASGQGNAEAKPVEKKDDPVTKAWLEVRRGVYCSVFVCPVTKQKIRVGHATSFTIKRNLLCVRVKSAIAAQ